MSIAKNFGAKIAATLIMAFAACLLSANMAFAADNFTVSCSVDNGDGTTTAITETIDIDAVIEAAMDDNDGDPLSAVYGMYYKSNKWNVLATSEYATFPDVVQAALDKYNGTHMGANYNYNNVVWNSTGRMTLTVQEADEDGNIPSTYTKHYPTLADMTTRLNFYGDMTNTVTTLTDSTWTNTAAVFTKHYGSAATADGALASTAAASALANQTNTPSYVRLITGCEDNMTSTTAMGKRYPYDIVGISF